MFRSKERLSSTLVNRVSKKGTPIGSGVFRARYLRSDDGRGVALVVSKKVIKGRIQRNRERRRILHLLKELLPSGYQMVLFLNQDTKVIPHPELKQTLQTLITQLKP